MRIVALKSLDLTSFLSPNLPNFIINNKFELNASKTKIMIVSRSHTMYPQSTLLTIGGTVLKESDDLVIL